MSHTIVILDRKSLIADLRTPAFPHEWVEYEQTQPSETAARIRDAHVQFTG